MRNFITPAIALSSVGLAIVLYLGGCGTQTQTTQGDLSDIAVTQIALMPFLIGQMESPNAPIVKPLSKPLAELVINGQDLPEGADEVMTRIVNAELKRRFEERLVSPDRAAEASRTLLADPALDTPRKRGISLGEALKANLVMVGTIWWFREKGALSDMPDSPASVGFALYLVDVRTGARVWRGAFEGTQEADMGLRWLSAEELARNAVKSVLQKLPLH